MKRLIGLLIAFMILGVGNVLAQGDENDSQLNPPPVPNFPLVLQAIQDNPETLLMDIQAASFGSEPITDFAPETPTCNYAGNSYLQEGVEAIRVNQVEIGDITYGNADPEVIYTLFYILLETEFEPMVSLLYPEIGASIDANITPQIPLGATVTVLGQMTCLLDGNMVGRFWEVEVNGITGFMLETLSWLDAVDLSSFWDIQDNPDAMNDINSPDTPILVEDVTFRLLMPYVEPPLTAIPRAEDINAGDSVYPTYCDHGAPSHLAVGMQAEMAGPTYMKFPNGMGIAADGADDGYSGVFMDAWDLSGLEIELDDFGLQVYVNLNNSIPLYQHPWMDLEGNMVIVDKATIYAPPVYGTQLVTIVEGPICSAIDNRYIAPDGIVEYNPEVTSDERFFTMWRVSLEVGGNTYIGWYPESVADYVWWLFEEGDTDRTHYLYFLQPVGLAPYTKDCEDRPAPILSAGMRVQPVYGGMNIRSTPNGLINRSILPSDTLLLTGQPVCIDGTHWWPVQGGGWIAENNPETDGYVVLLRPIPEESPSEPESQTPSEPESQTPSEPDLSSVDTSTGRDDQPPKLPDPQ